MPKPPEHGVWIEYESGRIRQMHTRLTVIEAANGRHRIFGKLKRMKDNGAIISAKKVGISGGPTLWK